MSPQPAHRGKYLVERISAEEYRRRYAPDRGAVTTAGRVPHADPMNKTEREWARNHTTAGRPWEFQAVTLRLGFDCRYTPDFLVIIDGAITFDEVKGFRRDDAMVKIRTAASKFPMFRFRLIEKNKTGWKITEIPA